MRVTNTLLLAIVISGLFILTGCVETEYSPGSSSSTPQIEQTKILDDKLTYGEFGNLIVTGTAQNVGEDRLSYAEIKARFYDKDDVIISTSFDNINDVDPGQKWKFEIMYFGTDTYNVDHYDIGIGSIW